MVTQRRGEAAGRPPLLATATHRGEWRPPVDHFPPPVFDLPPPFSYS
jgi:hypothetical protein